MREKPKPPKDFLTRTGEMVDSLVKVVNPEKALRRKAARFGYDAIDNSRTRKKRTLTGGTGDFHLTDYNLWRLREICRELMRNNPLVRGILQTERDGVVGDGVKIQAKTSDDGWNTAAEQLWKEEMIESPCDITGQYDFTKILREMYLSYRRDGDVGAILLDDSIQTVEGEQIGTPFNLSAPKTFDVINGLAFSKQTKKLIGYYVGSPDKYGFIMPGSFKKYTTEQCYMMKNPLRLSQTRGEPALTPSIDFIDKLCSYVDAELVAAKVNACFSMFVSKKDFYQNPVFSIPVPDEGKYDDGGNRQEKLEPGTIFYGEEGESATGIGQTRPGSLFDPFVLRMLTFIGRPLAMPLMLVTLDYAGATYMNARIAYQQAHAAWMSEQNIVLKPFVRKVWRWKIDQWVRKGLLTARDDVYRADFVCNRWPYVDPYREAQADNLRLENKTTTRTQIASRQGLDLDEMIDEMTRENKKFEKIIGSENKNDAEE